MNSIETLKYPLRIKRHNVKNSGTCNRYGDWVGLVDDETGRRFGDLQLQTQAQGVQVNKEIEICLFSGATIPPKMDFLVFHPVFHPSQVQSPCYNQTKEVLFN